jgi:hypothetical protein
MSSTKPDTTIGEKISEGIQKIFNTTGISNATSKLVDISKNMEKPDPSHFFKSYNIDDNATKNYKRPNLINMKSVMGVIIILVIVVFCILFKVPNPFTQNYSKSDQEATNNIFLVLFFVLLILGICIALLPNLKELKDLIYQINSVTYIIIYSIFLILFFSLMSKENIDKYAYIITPITILSGVMLFYKSLNQDYVEKFNVNYERIKSIILFFCLITILIIFYNNDPGGYINKYFGYSLLLTILIAVFAFVYLIIILTLPDKVKPSAPGAKISSFLDNFTGFSKYTSLGFLLFLIVVTIAISTYPGGFLNDKSTSAVAIIFILLISILWSIVLGLNLFPEMGTGSPVKKDLNLYKRSLLTLFSIVISILVIIWITYNISNLSGSGTTSFILNLSLVILILGLIYKTINVNIPSENGNNAANAKKTAFFSLLLNILLYIPCLFSMGFDFIGEKAAGKEKSSETGSIMMLVLTIVLSIVYFNMSYFVNIQGGKLLVNKPVNTDSIYSLGTYQDLNESESYDYQYALSFWVYINALGTNTNPSYGKYTSLLNFGEKPNILYNGKTNTLLVTMQQKDLKKVTDNKLIDFDENGHRIIYKNENVLLQKWNNIIINYSGGVLDIFLNGELVKSSIGVVPYYTLDSLTIGEDNGIKGGICNVVYYKQPLTSSKIYYLYNISKNSSPPIVNTSNVTILKEKIEKLK